MNIRKADISDLKSVEYICKQTAGELARTNEAVGNSVAKTYSTYYIEQETNSCFVLCDGENVVGYILCAVNYNKFKKLFRKKYVPQIYSYIKKDGIISYFIPLLYSVFKNRYPAHLHIDILENYTGNGNGTRLMNALLSDLKSKNIKGVMLIVNMNNKKAVNFYRKNGFDIIFSAFGGTFMGKSLN